MYRGRDMTTVKTLGSQITETAGLEAMGEYYPSIYALPEVVP